MQEEMATLKAVISYCKMPMDYIWAYKSQITLMHFIPVLLLSYPQIRNIFHNTGSRYYYSHGNEPSKTKK